MCEIILSTIRYATNFKLFELPAQKSFNIKSEAKTSIQNLVHNFNEFARHAGFVFVLSTATITLACTIAGLKRWSHEILMAF
jgi:hypothetical protein